MLIFFGFFWKNISKMFLTNQTIHVVRFKKNVLTSYQLYWGHNIGQCITVPVQVRIKAEKYHFLPTTTDIHIANSAQIKEMKMLKNFLHSFDR